MKTYYIYRHIRLDTNEVFYIGRGVHKTKAVRYTTEYSRAYEEGEGRRSEFWKRIFNKSKIRVEILFENLNSKEADEKEIEFIKLYGRRDLGLGTLTNLTNGGTGESKRVVTDELRALISKIHKGKTVSAETRLKMSDSGKGKKLSQEHIDKISKAFKGRVKSEEARKKLSLALTGRKFTDDHKKKLSEVRKGIPHSEKRSKTSVSGTIKAQEARKRPILQYDLEGNFIAEYESIEEASKHVDKTSSLIRCYLKNKIKVNKWFIWKYKH